MGKKPPKLTLIISPASNLPGGDKPFSSPTNVEIIQPIGAKRTKLTPEPKTVVPTSEINSTLWGDHNYPFEERASRFSKKDSWWKNKTEFDNYFMSPVNAPWDYKLFRRVLARGHAISLHFELNGEKDTIWVTPNMINYFKMYILHKESCTKRMGYAIHFNRDVEGKLSFVEEPLLFSTSSDK